MTFDDLRLEIAALAARLMANEGIDDFALAKRKAARQMDVPSSQPMPSNAQVDEALHAYRSEFRDEEDNERLLAMRQAAVEVMRLFAPLEPYLTGTVLEGTAGAFSEVELDVYTDSAKEVEIFMLNLDMEYEHEEVRKSGHNSPEAVLAFDWHGVPFKLAIFDPLALRSPRRNVTGGRAMERAKIEHVIALLAKAQEQGK